MLHVFFLLYLVIRRINGIDNETKNYIISKCNIMQTLSLEWFVMKWWTRMLWKNKINFNGFEKDWSYYVCIKSYQTIMVDFDIENYRLFYLNVYNISERKLSFILLLNAYLVHINSEVFNLKASYDDEWRFWLVGKIKNDRAMMMCESKDTSVK